LQTFANISKLRQQETSKQDIIKTSTEIDQMQCGFMKIKLKLLAQLCSRFLNDLLA
jgi:hypothetical protein